MTEYMHYNYDVTVIVKPVPTRREGVLGAQSTIKVTTVLNDPLDLVRIITNDLQEARKKVANK